MDRQPTRTTLVHNLKAYLTLTEKPLCWLTSLPRARQPADAPAGFQRRHLSITSNRTKKPQKSAKKVKKNDVSKAERNKQLRLWRANDGLTKERRACEKAHKGAPF